MQRGEARGSIIISAALEEEKEGRWMTLSVLDNGVGMEDPQEIYRGYGVTNVVDRIHLFYGEEYGISVQSVAGQKTVIGIRVPVIDGDAQGREEAEA